MSEIQAIDQMQKGSLAPLTLLVVEDDRGVQSQLKWALAENYNLFMAEDRQTALEIMAAEKPMVVILDLGLPPDANGATEGLSILETIREKYPTTKVIIASGNSDLQNALKAIELGAYDFYSKPIDLEVLNHIIKRAWHVAKLEKENERRAASMQNSYLDGIISGDPTISKIAQSVRKIASTDISVLITGESGTGKELVAKAIHYSSPRANHEFVAINCAAIPENLLESELFGFEKGSFTGAVTQSIGKVEMANQGTLFLDEIGDMPLILQSKLLRFLQERHIERIGGRKKIPIDIRVLCATHQNLNEMIAAGTFREDLFYRLNEFSISLPPLRERVGDIELLAKYFINRFSKELKKQVTGISDKALVVLEEYSWPGNIREFENKIKRAVIMTDKKQITAQDLELTSKIHFEELPTLKDFRDKHEKDLLIKALQATRGNVSLVSKILDISRPKVYEMIESYKIEL